jgi:hypothetical protein
MRSIVMMMVMVLSVIVFLAVIGVAVTAAAPIGLGLCDYAASVQVAYNSSAGHIQLVDQTSRRVVQTFGDDLAATHVLGWSPDCRYLVGVVGPFDRADVPAEAQGSALGGYLALVNEVVLWDVTTGERAVSFETPYRRFDVPQIDWAASTDGLTVLNSGATFEWTAGDVQLALR